jgi:hypothetical protein
MEFLQLKKEIAEYEEDLRTNHPNIIRVGDRPGNINMSEYTVTEPTNPIPSSD